MAARGGNPLHVAYFAFLVVATVVLVLDLRRDVRPTAATHIEPEIASCITGEVSDARSRSLVADSAFDPSDVAVQAESVCRRRQAAKRALRQRAGPASAT